MKVGNAIKKLRKKSGMTQVYFADKIGITQTYLSNLEKGHRHPSIDILNKIANVLETPLPVLFWFTLTEEDVKENKRDIFKLLKPPIDSLVDALFS